MMTRATVLRSRATSASPIRHGIHPPRTPSPAALCSPNSQHVGSFPGTRQRHFLRPSCSDVASTSQITRSQRHPRRHASTVVAAAEQADTRAIGDKAGPLHEYDRRVKQGLLRDDAHQRGIIKHLQRLHDELLHYEAPPIVKPDSASLSSKSSSSIFSWFSGGSRRSASVGDIPEDLPKGLYLYGDVGSGKTMLMDLFYDTIPSTVRSKLRIHFHNFMQDVHKRLHQYKTAHGIDVDAVPFVAADLAEQGNVFCFDEFQCTDVADAMILRRLLEALMSHGVVLVTTSNRHPDELYKNGIQRESFIPAITLLKSSLHVINLDSPTDYRKVARPTSNVYLLSLADKAAATAHADQWFRHLGDGRDTKGHPETRRVWGRSISVPRVSGRCARFTFDELIGSPLSAADYLELARSYDAFVVTDVPAMDCGQRDLARRFITFIDAVYEARGKLAMTCAAPLAQLFISPEEFRASMASDGGNVGETDAEVSRAMDHVMDDIESRLDQLKTSTLFSGAEEAFAFARALSRLTQMASTEWVEHRNSAADTQEATRTTGTTDGSQLK